MKKTAFKNMTTKVELVRRIERTEAGVNILSVGGQIKHVLPFLSSKPMLEQGYQVIEVEVEFANKLTGVDYATKYINIKDNLFDGSVSIDDANIIRELRCYGEDKFDENTTDEELCNVLGIDVEEFKEINKEVLEVIDLKEFQLDPKMVSKVRDDMVSKICGNIFGVNKGPIISTGKYSDFGGMESFNRFLKTGVIEGGKYDKESCILGVDSIEDYNESAGVLISSDSFINELKSREINNDAISLIDDYDDEIAKLFNADDKLELRRKTEKELIHDLNDKFVRDLMDISITFDNEKIDFNEYSDMFSKAVKHYNDTKESPEHKKELMRAKMYEKFFSPCENLR